MIELRRDDSPPQPGPDIAPGVVEDADCEEMGQPHLWQRVGFSPDWGDIYECSRCGGVTP